MPTGGTSSFRRGGTNAAPTCGQRASGFVASGCIVIRTLIAQYTWSAVRRQTDHEFGKGQSCKTC